MSQGMIPVAHFIDKYPKHLMLSSLPTRTVTQLFLHTDQVRQLIQPNILIGFPVKIDIYYIVFRAAVCISL